MAATLKDIASLLNVSVNTVSRALKDKEDIGLQTRRRVKEAAEALGYRPNLNARSLVLKKTNTVGLAITESNNPVRMELCDALVRRAAKDGYRLLTVALHHVWNQDNENAVTELLDRRVDGLILGAVWGLPGEETLGKVLLEYKKSQIPAVLFGNPLTELADCVIFDEEESTFLLMKYLLEKGYRSIRLFDGENSSIYKGCLRAAQAMDCPERFSAGPACSRYSKEAFEGMDQFLSRKNRTLPDAVIASNDLGAMGFIAALHKHGIKIPSQCAVAGFDNIAHGQFLTPALTSVGYDKDAVAETIWQLLYRRMNGKTPFPVKKVTVPYQLYIRKST